MTLINEPPGNVRSRCGFWHGRMEEMLEILKYPIIQAPMAGGVSTPTLAAAVSNAGGLGFLAGGYKTVEGLEKDIKELRGQTAAAFGVNLFVPGPDTADQQAVEAYRAELLKEAEKLNVSLGAPVYDDDAYAGKIELVRSERVPVVSFTFGCPSREVVQTLQEGGSKVVVTVTSAEEAAAALDAGADALCVQGAEAGGHRGTFSNAPEPQEDYGLLVLLRLVRKMTDVPLIAAGGIMDGAAIRAALAAGANAAQLGTAFLLCPESGTNPAYRQALTDPGFTSTRITRAFTGRRARGLVNRFMETYDALAPAAYPHVHHLTQQLRKEAAARGSAECMSLWAGQGYRMARAVPADQLIRELMSEFQGS